jgi:uncharacterized protein (TIGR00288 family)
MNHRLSSPASRTHSALIHRGPQANSAAATHAITALHAPNAALLIDFDNVTMGIRSDLGKELRSLLSSEIIKGKVAVQRAYADWRRYPQYIVPLSEASIDLIFAPAYGSSKKNATDIRLAIDALELVFTRPEIGTFILLSGDSDFSSLVIKLKEYGKYVIGVGIRESSSDLLVQNCDEYYSYNALAGLVKANDETAPEKYDPWELVSEALKRMKDNGDVMRSDRLKQVMQDIDASFDEKNLGHSKFSRFCQEAAQKGLLTVTKLDNGQLEVDLPRAAAAGTASESRTARAERTEVAGAQPGEIGAEERPRRSRRGRGGRGRGREGRETPTEGGTVIPTSASITEAPEISAPAPVDIPMIEAPVPPVAPAAPAAPAAPVAPAARQTHARPERAAMPEPENTGERLTRGEAFDLVRRAVEALAPGDTIVRASAVRDRARALLGRDSESLNERMFERILKDAHDQGIIDLRRRGNDFEVSRAVEAAPVAEQLARTEAAAIAASAPTTPAPVVPRGMGPRGAPSRSGRGGRPAAPPPDLFTVGIVDVAPAPSETAANASAEESEEPTAAAGGKGRKRGGAKRASTAKKSAAAPAAAPAKRAAKKPAARKKSSKAQPGS